MARLLAFATVVLVSSLNTSSATEVELCMHGDAQNHGACEASGASLMQKVFQREGKNTLAEASSPPACTGVATQGKCWYLSGLGESCAATCAKQGRSFSYTAADGAQPLTPQLAGREPELKQEPWAAFECFVPDESRYHTANANAAKHQDNLGAWSHKSCKLACPCGEDAPLGATRATRPDDDDDAQCSWKQPPSCAPEFYWEGVMYSGCLSTVDHDKPWCLNNRRGRREDWSYCVRSCDSAPEPAKPKDECQWIPSPKCVKEFDYSGAHYVGCTAADLGTPWCSNSKKYRGEWSYCVDTCAEKAPTGDLCTWEPKPQCAKTFVYKDVEYTGCTDLDHPTPWCSHDQLHKGVWSTCERFCATPKEPATPKNGDLPCDRHPEVENDEIGQRVTLDEAGYKIAAAASTTDSAINMKRFVCRTADKLKCKVVQLSALLAFVPYYSGLVAQQTYTHLESELSTLCHAGGKWIVPTDMP